MPIRFAASRPSRPVLSSAVQRRRIVALAANDNHDHGDVLAKGSDLRAALRHFAEHGLSAPTVARRNAEQAFFRGDRAAYRHWLAVCRTLDRRAAGLLPPG
jgi:hypothetical protein